MTDYYRILGVDRNASASEVKVAFRKLALKFHPDRHATSSDYSRDAASQRFKELLEAYEVLSDEKKRRLYNRAGKTGFRYGGSQQGYQRGGDAARGAYGQGPFQGGVHPRGRWSSLNNSQWKFSFRLGRADYVFHGLIITVAFIGFTTAGTAADALWKIQNTGKSFEDTIEAVERRKKDRRTDERTNDSPSTPR